MDLILPIFARRYVCALEIPCVPFANSEKVGLFDEAFEVYKKIK